MMWLKRILVFGLLLITGSRLYSQTFHYLGFYDTNDSSIGQGVKVDLERTTELANTLSDAMASFGYKSDMKIYSGSRCGKENLMAALDAMQTSPDDIVLFFYNGHGAHALGDEDRFPQMCLGEIYQSNYVPATLVKNILVGMGVRFAMVITACCNSESEWVTPKETEIRNAGVPNQSRLLEICRKMFIEPEGWVMFTSSRRGEYSWVNSMNGTWFVRHSFDAWNNMMSGSLPIGWESFCARVQQTCSADPIHYHDQVYLQHPDYLLSWQILEDLPVENITPRTASAVPEAFQDLNISVNRLLDKSLSQSQKQALIQDIKTKWLRSNTIVITYLEDRNTMIRYEKADEFLRRLSLSSAITRVSFFQSDNNKYSVYEYR